MAKKEQTKTIVWVFWILIAIIGTGLLFTGLLFTGLQNSFSGENLGAAAMLIVFGIALIFVGLIMLLGKANIETSEIELPGKKETEKK